MPETDAELLSSATGRQGPASWGPCRGKGQPTQACVYDTFSPTVPEL